MSGFAGMMLNSTRTISSGATDPYWGNVSLLIQGGGTAGSGTITDASGSAHSITNSANNAIFSSSVTKFASTSIHFRGASYLLINTTTALQMPGDFTWEAWVYPTNLSGFKSMIGTSAIYGRILISQNSGLYWESDNGSSPLAVSSGFPPTGSWTVNAWQHVALTRSGSSWRFFKDGVQQGTTKTASFTPETSQNLNIGSAYGAGNYFIGYMDGIRYTKGVARYTADFTPPTDIFPTS